MEIKIEKQPQQEKLKEMGVFDWSIWEKEVSEFPWSYDSSETCYVLEGRAEIAPKEGEPFVIEKGDLVIFPKGMECDWKITDAVRKHYKFE